MVYMSDFDASLRPTHRMYVCRAAQLQQHALCSFDLRPFINPCVCMSMVLRSHRMDLETCFLPGMLALGVHTQAVTGQVATKHLSKSQHLHFHPATPSASRHDHCVFVMLFVFCPICSDLAKSLMETCMAMATSQPSGLPPSDANFGGEVDDIGTCTSCHERLQSLECSHASHHVFYLDRIHDLTRSLLCPPILCACCECAQPIYRLHHGSSHCDQNCSNRCFTCSASPSPTNTRCQTGYRCPYSCWLVTILWCFIVLVDGRRLSGRQAMKG